MKKTIQLLKTLRKDITILFIICLTTILSLDFWLKGIPEFFNGGAKIGDIIYKLCMSYISAYIFYFLVVHIKAQKDKANIYGYVTKKVYMVIGSCWGLIDTISKAANITLPNRYPNDEQLSTICKAINPNSNAPLTIGRLGNYANWIQYFDFQKQRSNLATEKIFSKMPFLDTKLVNLLAKIDDCFFFFVTESMVQSMPIRNTDLTTLQKELAGYFDLIKELEIYTQEKLKDYK
jgi:hypothetical protein